MSLYNFVTSRSAALAVAALLLMGKTATADQRQPAPGEPERAAHFAVTVPADAEVWFDGVKADQAGPYREFVSPPLHPGRSFSYDVRVHWKNKGREDDLTRHVTFYAGDQVNLDFTGDRVQTQHFYYGTSSVDSREVAQAQQFSYYAPSYKIVPRRLVRSLSGQDPTVGRWRTSASDW